MMITKRRHYVTLLELLLVMAVLLLISGVVAIGIRRASVEQSFRTEVSGVVDYLRLAQDLMLIVGTDIHLKFAVDQGEKGIIYWLEFETPLQKGLEKELFTKKQRLKTIRGYFFDDKLGGGQEKNVSDIKFLSRGMVMSEGIIRLASTSEQHVGDNVLEAFIPLAGYPRPIRSYETREAAQERMSEYEDPSFDDAFTQDTFAKLPSKEKEEKGEK